MHNEKKQQARDLFASTDMNKSQVAKAVGVDRRTISSWVKEENWDRLRRAARNLPSILVENCYHLFGHQVRVYLDERRAFQAMTMQEADILYRLSATICKLRGRNTLNDNMETLTAYVAFLKKKDKKFAEEANLYADEFLAAQADLYRSDLLPPELSGTYGTIPALWEGEKIMLEEERIEDIKEIRSVPHVAISDDGNIVYYDGERLESLKKEWGLDDTPEPPATPTETEEHIPAHPSAPDNYRDALPCTSRTENVRSAYKEGGENIVKKPIKKLNINNLKKSASGGKKLKE